jgi:arginase
MKQTIHLFIVPYDSGHKSIRMGRGPDYLLQNGLAGRLEAGGRRVQIETIEAPEGFHSEVKTSFDLYGRLAERVQIAALAGSFPLVLSGNCGAALGSLAGLGSHGLGLAWFDAHGDFNTPETTISGFLDGMALATAAGRCWKNLVASLPGFSPVLGSNIVHVGGRDFDPEERNLLEQSGAALINAQQVRTDVMGAVLIPALNALNKRARAVYVHFDLDTLDPEIAPANQFLPSDGLSLDQAVEALIIIKERFPVRGAGFSAYDPEYDPQGRTLMAAIELIEQVVR